MKRDSGSWVAALVALVVLALVAAQTLAALRVSGAFGWHAAVPRSIASPVYFELERAMNRSDPSLKLADVRDPFTYGRGPAPGAPRPARAPVAASPEPVPAPALPVLTAIVWDNDARALVRWKQREWTVREGGLFDEFQVVSITRDQVTLRRGPETIVLKQRNPGE